MKPREYRRLEKRNGILKTALALVLEKGPDRLSLRELAKRVNYSPAGLYEFFKNKEEIIAELHHMGFFLLTEKLQSVEKTVDPKKDLLNIGLSYLKFARENCELYQLIFSYIPSSKKTLDELARTSESFGILYSAIEAFLETAGKIKPDFAHTIEDISFSYWATLHGLSILPITIIKSYDHDFKQSQENTLNIFINGLNQL